VRIAALILAAGEGRRVGGPKALLKLEGTTFVERCCLSFSRPDIDDLLVVLGCDFERALRHVAPHVMVVRNSKYENGMLSSLLCGLALAETRGAEAVLVHPVDHPLVTPATITAVVSALRQGAVLAVPTHGGRRGHPTGFAAPSWPALRAAPSDRGARAVLAEHPEWITHTPGDAFCLSGVNTPEELAALAARPASAS
jgi:CTP:molybdopterin cytidylyltransferase MocA